MDRARFKASSLNLSVFLSEVFFMPKILISYKDGRHRIEPDLIEAEIYAIGYVTAAWAILEHNIFLITSGLAEETGIPLPEDAKSGSFIRRLRTFRSVVLETLGKKQAQPFMKIADSIGSMERSRHRITHGIWEWHPSKPEKVKGLSFRTPYEFEEPFDVKKLMGIGYRIGEFNFQLLYPGGKNQAMEHLIESSVQHGGFVSREFLLGLLGKEIASPHLGPPILPKRKKPQSSSK